jgi:hypothetical protein
MFCGLRCELMNSETMQIIDNKQQYDKYWRAGQDQSEYWEMALPIAPKPIVSTNKLKSSTPS